MTIEITISEDRLVASCQMPLIRDGRALTPREFKALVDAAGIQFGIQVDNIKSAYATYEQSGETVELPLALGAPPQDGEDGRIDVFIEEQPIGKMRPDGTMDYKDRPQYHIVTEGQAVAELHPPTTGMEGHDVFGQVITPTSGAAPELKIGDNICYDEELQRYHASIPGLLMVSGNMLAVEEALVLPAINLESGHLEFNHNVIVENDIEPEMKVFVKGDLYVQGNIDNAEVIVEGNLKVDKGIATPRQGFVEVTGSLEVNHIENATVRAGNTIYIHTEAHHSHIAAGNAIVATSRKGQIAGGACTAMNTIQVNILGNRMAPLTRIAIGPRHDSRTADIVNDLEEGAVLIRRLNDLIGARRSEGSRLKERSVDTWKQLNRRRRDLAGHLYFCLQDLAQATRLLSTDVPQLIVTGKSYANVTLAIDGHSMILDADRSALRYLDQPDGILASRPDNALSKWLKGRTPDELLLREKDCLAYAPDGYFLREDVPAWTSSSRKNLLEWIEIAENIS